VLFNPDAGDKALPHVIRFDPVHSGTSGLFIAKILKVI
jgi:hypothetical protein